MSISVTVSVFKFSIRDLRPLCDLVLLEPGLPCSDLAIHGAMQIKETNGLSITGQIRLFTYVTVALGSAPLKLYLHRIHGR